MLQQNQFKAATNKREPQWQPILAMTVQITKQRKEKCRMKMVYKYSWDWIPVRSPTTTTAPAAAVGGEVSRRSRQRTRRVA